MSISLVKEPIKVVFHAKIIFLSKYIHCFKLKKHVTTFARINFNLDHLYKTKLKICKKIMINKQSFYYQCINFNFERQNFETKSLYEASIGFVLDQILVNLDKSIHFFVRIKTNVDLVFQRGLYFTSKKSQTKSDKSLFYQTNDKIKKITKNLKIKSKQPSKQEDQPVHNSKLPNNFQRKSTRVKISILRLGY